MQIYFQGKFTFDANLLLMQIYFQGKFIFKANLYLELKNHRKKKKKATETRRSNREKNKARRGRRMLYKYMLIVIQGFNIKTSQKGSKALIYIQGIKKGGNDTALDWLD